MKKILVADDSVTIQKVIALTFADEPVDIQSVGSGSDALDKMRDWKPDIVLADVIMPQVNGYELCRAVKENESTRDIPVLLLAGTFEAFDEEEAKGAGADGFITKPFEALELIEKVNGLMEKGVQVEPPRTPVVEPAFEPAQKPVFEPVQGAADTEPAPATVPPVEETISEPDIWDILSEADEMEPVKPRGPTEVETASPSLGPLEGSGVVDFGSFDIGLDRAEESHEVPMVPTPDAIQPPEMPPPEMPPPEMPPPVMPPPVMPVGSEGESKIERREKDFFGFETGRTDSGSLDIMEDAIEEIIFDVEEPAPSGVPDPDPFKAQESVPLEIQEPASFKVQEPAPFEIQEPASFKVQEPAPFEIQESVPQDAGKEETAFTVHEPLPDGSHGTAEAVLSQIDDAQLESIIREAVEKKVEKIVWEVVPELSEILIREAIEKIRGGRA